jgi:hypothetical protein
VINSPDDLAGKTVHVRKSSSFYESLIALNDRFMKESKPAANFVLVPDALEDEDMLEMLDAVCSRTTLCAPSCPTATPGADQPDKVGLCQPS